MTKHTSLFVSILVVLAAAALLSGCSQQKADTPATETTATTGALGAFANLTGELDIAGGTAHIPVMNEAAQRIMKAYPGVRITVAGGGSGVGVQKVGEGLVQIGNTGRALSDEEIAQYGLKSFPFAVDGVCAVVHPDNPVAALTAQQLQDIFAGRIDNWQAVGGPDHEIHLYTRDEASGTRKVFWKKALAKGEVAAKANVVASNGAMKTAVGGDPYALGYISIGHLDASLKAPALDGVEITQKNAADGTYPVVRKLYMNTKGEPTALAKAFIDYVDSDEGAAIIAAKGYIPLSGK